MDHFCRGRDSQLGAGVLVCRIDRDRSVGVVVVHIRPPVVLGVVGGSSVRSLGHSLRIVLSGSVRADSLEESSLLEEGLDAGRGRPFRGGRSGVGEVYETGSLHLAAGDVLPGSGIEPD
jgi:hypothetical protein